jgi:hypothetical protein
MGAWVYGWLDVSMGIWVDGGHSFMYKAVGLLWIPL